MTRDPIDFEFLARAPLFRGAQPQQINGMLGCLGATQRAYAKGELILRRGQRAKTMGLVLAGSVSIESSDISGSVSVLGHVGPGRVFAETYAALPEEPMVVDVVALEPTRVLFLNVAQVMHTCSHACAHHQLIADNLFAIFARKNLGLSQRIFSSAPKSIRGKVLAYLAFQASANQSLEFDIPFNRQQLADYLGVDRSALSAELSHMAKEGILETRRSHFRLFEQ
ncbi:Crp/Fnr family transcriptional regulator [Curtanaerobium respiraculi]|uniref:Crp/Fnr family transcriptional regulator n=1 Tax=Curtanaerobium respiraculi TaxID=2949669 RepID=UPI0024B35D30|nr:Crp/Fnr family transcriptional regulator [Curtanaerobium respiraculi]